MKKSLKIAGWTLIGIVSTIIVVACIAIYIVFTPERLTPIARQVAAKVITCEHELGEVDLTFFSTFPRFGFRADGFVLINPKAGAQNDTVVSAGLMSGTIDMMEFLRHRNLHLHEAILDNARVNFFMAPDGTTNLTKVFVLNSDTTPDTTAFKLPFDAIQIDGLHLYASSITFVDAKDTIEASLGVTELSAAADSWDEMLFAVDAQDVCASLKNDVYADHMHIEGIAPMAVNMEKMHFDIGNARLALNEFNMALSGTVDLKDSIGVNLLLETEKWQIKPVLALIPARFASLVSDLDIDGKMRLKAKLAGFVTSNQLPRVQAHVQVTEAAGSYKPMPYILEDVAVDAEMDLRLNEGEQSMMEIRSLEAKTMQTAVKGKGAIEDLLGDLKLNLALVLDANLPDLDYFMPDQMTLSGHAQGNVNLNMKLSDLTTMKLDKGNIDADLALQDFHLALDSMIIDMPRTHARIHMPNRRPSHSKLKWARIEMETDQMDFSMATPLTLAVKKSKIQLESGDVLSNDPVLYAGVGLQTEQSLYVTMDSMEVTALAPRLTAYAEYNTKDTTVMPNIQTNIEYKALNGYFKDTKVDLKESQLEASITSGRKDKSTPVFRAKLNTQAADVALGDDLKAKTGVLALEAGARYNAKEKDNFLLQWNPRLNVNLKSGELSIPERLPEIVRIPSIEFVYSNRELNIENSRIELGRSDLNLSGNVRNIGKWFRKDSILEGELNVISDHCDANQLLDWFSADSGSEEKPAPEKEAAKPAETAEKTEEEPFLVPSDVDLALNTHIREIEIFDQVAKDLKGGLYVKDGKLILDEVGFVCHAAKLQLTAIYRTPRRNHLYMGLDYHMVDVKIDELLAMIPNLKEMMPMLSAFKGEADFHLAAETYLNSQYQPKMSTLRGAASLSGTDLVVMDGETFTKISKMLMFNKKTENKIDSLNAEITVYKNEIDVYPLCVSIDNYMFALGGRHKTDMTFDYDINVLKPIYLGVHVGGNMDDLQIKLTPNCKFAQDFRPHWNQKVDTQSRELRQMIKASMVKNVRIKSDKQK